MGRRKKLDNAADDCRDDKEIIDRCLNCPFPPSACKGELRCRAEWRTDASAQRESILYGRRKGMQVGAIARQLGIAPTDVSACLLREKRSNKND